MAELTPSRLGPEAKHLVFFPEAPCFTDSGFSFLKKNPIKDKRVGWLELHLLL